MMHGEGGFALAKQMVEALIPSPNFPCRNVNSLLWSVSLSAKNNSSLHMNYEYTSDITSPFSARLNALGSPQVLKRTYLNSEPSCSSCR